MQRVEKILQVHPNSQIAGAEMTSLVQELMDCEATCIVCADACLSEQDVQTLAKCIALNIECADMCASSAKSALRVGHIDPTIMRAHLETCRESCRMCAEECERHDLEHCRVCAESCHSCERACQTAMERMMTMV